MRDRVTLASLALAVGLACGAQAADRPEITFADGRIFPESLTSTQGRHVVFRQPRPGQRLPRHAEVVEGRHVDSGRKAMACRGARRVRGRGRGHALGLRVGHRRPRRRSAGRRDGAEGIRAFEGRVVQGAATRFRQRSLQRHRGRERRHRATRRTRRARACCGSRRARARSTSGRPTPRLLDTADGIALLADGAVYVNSVGQGTLLRIPVKADGSAGTIAKLETSQPLTRPDGMRSVGGKTMLLVEGAGTAGRSDDQRRQGRDQESSRTA